MRKQQNQLIRIHARKLQQLYRGYFSKCHDNITEIAVYGAIV